MGVEEREARSYILMQIPDANRNEHLEMGHL